MNALETTTSPATEPASVPATASSVATSRRSRRARFASVLFAAIVGIGMFGSQAAPTHAASVGPYAPAYATCNWRYHTITLTAQAGAAPGYATQTVYYKYWVWDVTLGRFVAGLGPTNFGSIAAWSYQVVNGITYVNNGTVTSAPSVFQLTAGHRYTVVAEYWWNLGGAWFYTQATTTDYGNVGYAWDVQVRTNNGCVA